ncbi:MULTISPECIES: C40 family peptidase [unclassified Moraxella]|uniref:C40 family peptidase n=1 Tax=unclassified Moraxella TaxID=2685852 RepID=UPI00359D7705
MRLTKTLKDQIHAHAKDDYPNECCGLIVQSVADGTVDYVRLPNVAKDPLNHFEIDPQDYADFEYSFGILAIVHSHPNGTAEPSEIDRIQMTMHGKDWVICGCGFDLVTGEWYSEIKRHKPTKEITPLLGREYVHGYQDCYSLVRDYYKRELSIELPDFARTDDWWENPNHEPLYENNFTKAGFDVIDDPAQLQKHDVILCRVGRTHHINHALVFIGNGKLQSESTPDCVGDCLVLHHPHSALSKREIYGESWQKRTAMVVRHRQFLA